VASEFGRALAARGLVDFDGLISLPVALLRDEPAVAAALRARWRSISVDEYQDTDAAQHDLLRLLAGDGRGLAVIGDPDQAIYSFRGADVSFFVRFGRDYPGARTVALTRNYRSSQVILSGALQAVGPATLVPGRRLTAAAGPGTDAGAGGRGGDAAAGASAGSPGGSGAAGRITVHEAADERAEAAWIAQAIDRLLGGASFHSLDSGRADGHAGGRLALADFAVLYRTDAQAGPLGEALTRAGLPYQKRSHDLLARRPAVPEVVAQMRMVPGPGSAADRLAAAVRTLAGRVPPQAGAGAGARGTPCAPVDILAAGEVLAPLARRCGDDLDRFLTEVALGAEADALDPRADAVTLLTMHAAKGLEFGVVFVAGCERGLLPLWLPGTRCDPAEERRLLFVAMTRAREHLFLTCAARRRGPARMTEAGPSPFLASIDPRLLDSGPPARPRRAPAAQLRLL
jgi:superfamily I DNA/RNA helicase